MAPAILTETRLALVVPRFEEIAESGPSLLPYPRRVCLGQEGGKLVDVIREAVELTGGDDLTCVVHRLILVELRRVRLVLDARIERIRDRCPVVFCRCGSKCPSYH